MAKTKEVVEGQVVAIRPKTPTDWDALLQKVSGEHWRKLKITLQIREKMHGGKPRQLDAAKAMLNARGLGDAIEAVNVGRGGEI